MSTRLHQSDILVEHPASPPHLLSPTLLPSVPYTTSLETPDRGPAEQATQIEFPVEEEALTMDVVEQTPASDVDHDAAVTHETTNEPLAEQAPSTEAPVTAAESDTHVIVESSAVEEPTMRPENTEPPSSIESPVVVESQVSEQSTEDTLTENAGEAPSTIVVAADVPESSEPSPPEPEVDSEPEDNSPAWVRWDEDLSLPDEEEMKEIEGSEYDKLSATHVSSMEAQFYSDLDDPEQRPAKKLRLNWVIKGVRGTKQKPNMARVMNSPAVCVDGLYWSIKFYPRGDNCTSLSAFVRCSRNPPKQAEEMPEYSFAFYEGLPDADFGDNYEPKVNVSAPNTQRVREQRKPKKKELTPSEASKKSDDDGDSDDPARETTPREPESSDRRDEEDEDANDVTDDADDKNLADWRVSAQLGMAIYNPAEPRTGHLQSDGHQFSKHCDDWGWVNFVGPWDEIHKRKRGQRKPLLQNDTLAIDAYVRIYDDPTLALWWHDSKTESQWPSKQLAGYYPMGTPALYHSSGVAGFTAWSILAPLREILQNADGGQWRNDSSIHPKPIICQSQLVLHQMRTLTSECYVNVFKVIEELTEADEQWEDVKTFWEVYRRGLELEFSGNELALSQFATIFDAGGKPFKMLSVPVPGEDSVASGITKTLQDQKFKGALPNFLPIMLDRQRFDKRTKEWKLSHDRVRLSDELDLSEWTTESDGQYTLYGFIVHVGNRNSCKFYSVLRPNGIGTKWLAFEDGNGNKVFSYTKKRIEEFEGLEGDELKDFSGNRENAYMAMYVRNSCWSEYLLPGGLEPYKLPKWLRNHSDGNDELTDGEKAEEERLEAEFEKKQEEEGMTLEIYLDEFLQGHENVLDLHDIRMIPAAKDHCQIIKVATDKTYRDLRQKIVEAFELKDIKNIGLWEISYRSLGKFSRAELEGLVHRKIERDVRTGMPLRIWLSVLEPAEGKSSYKNMLPRIAEMGLEKKAPEPEPETVQHDAGVSEKNGTDDAEALSEIAAPATETSPSEGDLHSADTSSSHTDESHTTGVATPATGATGDSAQDVEQASVEAAVATDLENANVAQHDGSAAADTTRTIQSLLRLGQGTDILESIEHVSSTIDPQTERDSSTNETSELPVEHGHLIEAASPTNNALPTSTERNSNVASQVFNELSTEDAIAIAAVLAADADENSALARATEPTIESQTEAGNDITQTSPASDDVDNRDTENTPVEAEVSRSPTPPPIEHMYGFIHFFDAEAQKFVAQKPLIPEVDQEIGVTVRKALGYDDDKEVKLWKREGPSGTVSVTSSSTFAATFESGFSIIVGNVLSENKIEELKQAGKFPHPKMLIKHLHNTKRNHPILSKTSTDPVEVAEFGGTYFKGPLVNGQPHGQDCIVISSSGHTYEGSMIAGLKSGEKGKMTYQNGDLYVGGWLNDERHGQGEHTEARTGNRYVGGFENGKRWGEGVTYWKVADDQAAMCQICYGEEIDALFYDCGHVCACVECAKQCDTCPICRKPVRSVVKMFRA